MIEAGTRYRHLVQFLSGEPTTDFTYTLYNEAGGIVTTDTVTIPTGTLSYAIEISDADNTLNNPLFEKMRLEWSYDTAALSILDSLTYTIYAPIPFPVTNSGVREFLGVNTDELPDSEIDMLKAYVKFRGEVGDTTDLSAYEGAGTYDSYRITKSIEASAALLILPTLQISLPKKYDSGTSAYERWTTIDWDALAAKISDAFYDGILAIDPNYEPFPVIEIFALSDRDADPITGV